MIEKIKRLAKWLISAKTQAKVWSAVIVALAVAWATYLLGPRGTPKATENNPLAQDQEVAVDEMALRREKLSAQLATSRIRFADWQRLVKSTTNASDRKALVENYRGEMVTWEGVFDRLSEISPENGGNPNQRYLLVMYESETVRTGTELSRAPALCVLSESAGSELQELSPGKQVVVQGTLAAPETLHGTQLGTRLYNCEVVWR
jgi:hypothetical protein